MGHMLCLYQCTVFCDHIFSVIDTCGNLVMLQSSLVHMHKSLDTRRVVISLCMRVVSLGLGTRPVLLTLFPPLPVLQVPCFLPLPPPVFAR